MGDLYNNLLGGKQAARLDNIVALLHEIIMGMQKFFFNSITRKIIKTDKTTNVLMSNGIKNMARLAKHLQIKIMPKKTQLFKQNLN